jgi:hypothetical protein
LTDSLRHARPHAPPIEQLSALLLAQPRCPLVGLRKRLVHPLVADHHLVNGPSEENGAQKELLETRSVRWSFEAEGCPVERKRFQQQLTREGHSRCSIALDEELPAIFGNVTIVQHDPEPLGQLLGLVAIEGKGEIEVANREIDRTAQGAAAEERVAQDSVAREPVSPPSFESDARDVREVVQEVAHDREFLARLDLEERVLEAVDRDCRTAQTIACQDPALSTQAHEQLDACDPANPPIAHQFATVG